MSHDNDTVMRAVIQASADLGPDALQSEIVERARYYLRLVSLVKVQE